jgi:hypothetical protein
MVGYAEPMKIWDRVVRVSCSLAVTLLDVLQPPLPARVTRWLPFFVLASSGERAATERWRKRLRG